MCRHNLLYLLRQHLILVMQQKHRITINVFAYQHFVYFLCRILKMMHTVASHTSENRMTASAVAACMAPLLLRPLLAGECEMDEVFDMDGDDSAQLLAAANAANSAQGIVATLLEEYEGIFHVRFFQPWIIAVSTLNLSQEKYI
jgi:hypothetical protein